MHDLQGTGMFHRIQYCQIIRTYCITIGRRHELLIHKDKESHNGFR